jgi:hypothetical protein
LVRGVATNGGGVSVAFAQPRMWLFDGFRRSATHTYSLRRFAGRCSSTYATCEAPFKESSRRTTCCKLCANRGTARSGSASYLTGTPTGRWFRPSSVPPPRRCGARSGVSNAETKTTCEYGDNQRVGLEVSVRHTRWILGKILAGCPSANRSYDRPSAPSAADVLRTLAATRGPRNHNQGPRAIA